jgi:hypothetical protein
MTLIQGFIVFGLVILLGAFYAIGMYFNKRTPLPEGCELPSLKCEHCSSVSCGYSEVNRPISLKDEIKKEIAKSKVEEGGING